MKITLALSTSLGRTQFNILGFCVCRFILVVQSVYEVMCDIVSRVSSACFVEVLSKYRQFRSCSTTPKCHAIYQRSPTNGPRTTEGLREYFGGPWRNLDIICNFYVYYTVSLYTDSSSCHRHGIADNFRLITLHQIHVPRTTTIALTTLFIVVFV
jgi:hypothetical protein